MEDRTRQPLRAVIIGAGHVGSTCAYSLQLSGLVSEIILINQNRERAKGEAMDLNHGMLFARPVRIWDGDVTDCSGADIVVLAAGVAQQPGETKLNLLKRNANMFMEIVPKIAHYTSDAILIVVTNPVDILTYVTWKISNLPPSQVNGINHMSLSLPSIVNRQGISHTLELPLAADERIALVKSSLILQSAIESLKQVYV